MESLGTSPLLPMSVPSPIPDDQDHDEAMSVSAPNITPAIAQMSRYDYSCPKRQRTLNPALRSPSSLGFWALNIPNNWASDWYLVLDALRARVYDSEGQPQGGDASLFGWPSDVGSCGYGW